MSDARDLRVARAFGVGDVVAAVLVLFAVFAALPARWWLVDGGAIVVAGLLGAAGGGLLAQTPWAERVARAASIGVLGIGLVLIATLALTASYLSGVYGPVGRGGAVILALSAALAIPYLVILPAAQLVWLGLRATRTTPDAGANAA
jgi:hypothetical protein